MWQQLNDKLKEGDIKALARTITLVENRVEGYEEFLQKLPATKTGIIGVTGPPGAGKSTLVDALIGEVIGSGKKVGVLCVDPSSPFNLGALLGDRVRMSEWYNNPNVFIRSLATRGSLGGLHPMIVEISDIIKAAAFDYIFVETVGVGQSEIEIAGLADTTVVVLVPEAGDEVQTMKAGLMEIADIFVINKADRPGADSFVKNLKLMLAPAFQKQLSEIPIIKTVALEKSGVPELLSAIQNKLHNQQETEIKPWLLAEKAYQLIQHKRMNDITKHDLQKAIKEELQNSSFNIYRFVKEYISSSDTK
jgi:LAO/AO transport system kinase